MSYVTDATVQGAIAGCLGLSGASALPSHWLTIEPIANTWATNKINSILAGRGFSNPAQFASFDNVITWNLILALGKSMQMAGLQGQAFQQKPIDDMVDTLKEIQTDKITIAGILQLPQGPLGLRVGSGPEDTSQDRIQLQPPDGTGQFILPPPGDNSVSTGTVL